MLEHLCTADSTPQRVVVIGARGFVGQAVMALMAAQGIPALGLGRQEVDLLAPDAAEQLAVLLKPTDSVVAAAAIAPCKNADMLVQNMVLARNIVKALTLTSVAHVVNISSDAVYGDFSEPMTEDFAQAPQALHGVMHLARELMFRDAIKVPLAMLRPSLLYGAQDPHNGYGPNRFRRQALRGEAITLFGQGEERRDHVYIGDVAQLVLRVLLRRSTGALNIATGQLHSFHDIAQEVVKLTASSSAIVGSERVGPMPHNGYRAFDSAATARAFPDFHYTSLDQGLRLSL